jgi:hypothetical protein
MPGQEHGAVELALAPDAYLVTAPRGSSSTDARLKPSSAALFFVLAIQIRTRAEEHEAVGGTRCLGALTEENGVQGSLLPWS